MNCTITTPDITDNTVLDNQFASPDDAMSCVGSMIMRLSGICEVLQEVYEEAESAEITDGIVLASVDSAIEKVSERLEGYYKVADSLERVIREESI